MKKLCRKSLIHPTQSVLSDKFLLSFLPAAILTLTVALSPEDREVLSYLISCSSSNFHHREITGKSGCDHPSSISCNCFMCYMSYWVKWDSSPNRQLIHEIIDAFEESLLVKGNKEKKTRRERRKGKNVNGRIVELKKTELSGEVSQSESNSIMEVDMAVEEGRVSRFVSFVGEKIWSVWG